MNPHEHTPTRSLVLPVCQFQHSRKRTNAEEGSRTLKVLLPHGPEPCASANSATSAFKSFTNFLINSYNYSTILFEINQVLFSIFLNYFCFFPDYRIIREKSSKLYFSDKKKANCKCNRLLFFLMREMGLEPTRAYTHKILSLACLPIPALPLNVW